MKSSGATESVLFKWQARNKGGTWVDLHNEVTYPADASAYSDYTYSGRFKPVANFNAVPFDVRLIIKSGSAGGENAAGKTKIFLFGFFVNMPGHFQENLFSL